MEARISYLLSAVMMLIIVCTSAHAQERKLVRKGNELYMQQKYAEAAKVYQQALQQQPTFTPGAFNLGDALVQQKQYDAARKVMANAAKSSKDPLIQSGAHYNTGNTYMSEQQWQQAVDAYKQALRRNPQDADAKYNLSYALAKLKQQQGGGGGGKDNQKSDQQNKDNKKNQDQQKNDKNQQQQDQDQNDQQQKHPEPQQSKISEQQADNLLKALQQDERKAQDKMQRGKATPIRMEKDW